METGKRRPPEHSQFKPGQSGNPGGRPKLPEDVKEARKLNTIELERLLNRVIWMTKEEIAKHVKDPATPAFEVLIASIVLKGISGGDHQRANWITDRLAGKVKEQVDVHLIKRKIIERLDGSEEHLIAEEDTE